MNGDVADQQLCVAAQPLVAAVDGRGELGAADGQVPDARELAARALDAELQAALTAVGDTYAGAAGEAPDAAAWREADRAVATLDRVCQRLSAF